MSVKVSTWVWHETPPTLTASQMLVLLALADVADDRGRCVYFADDEPTTQEALAAKSRVSVRTFRRVIQDLQTLGLLSVKRADQWSANEYKIMCPAASEAGNVPATDREAKLAPQTGHSDLTDRPTATELPDTVASHSSLKRIDVVNAHFESFWTAYPRKVAKGAARKKFEQLAAKKNTNLEAIVSGAERFARDPNLSEMKFIPYPATWLNGGQWEDEPLPTQTQPAINPYAGRKIIR
ncbi:hypothetical protein GCM10022198_00430 [Klugiella xanthotipulae]|uniref:helix-turn-helix domain-containing protein n=1 Tax=Klugiella xanthotipulae TaxID=244735 RepID=UPI001476F3A8|nr:helix-turn-helix domain-containing protein [Klugiella xanthotipulae]